MNPNPFLVFFQGGGEGCGVATVLDSMSKRKEKKPNYAFKMGTWLIA